MEWISVKEKLPEGKGKVLLWRKTTPSQESMSISVFPASSVKHCDDTTYWMPLPEPPK